MESRSEIKHKKGEKKKKEEEGGKKKGRRDCARVCYACGSYEVNASRGVKIVRSQRSSALHVRAGTFFFDLDRICFSARSCFFFFVFFFSAPPGLLPAKTKTSREELKRERHGERVIERDAQ